MGASTLTARPLWGSAVGTAPFSIERACFADDAASLWLFGRDGARRSGLARLDVRDGGLRDLRWLPVDPGQETRTAFLRGGERMVLFERQTSGAEARVTLWDLREGAAFAQFGCSEPRELVQCLAGRSWFVLAGTDSRAEVFDLEGRARYALSAARTPLSISHDDRWLAVRDLRGRGDGFELLSLDEGTFRPLALGRAGLTPYGLHFLPDGSLLVHPDRRSRELCFFDVATESLRADALDDLPWYTDPLAHGACVVAQGRRWLVTGASSFRAVDVPRPFSGAVRMTVAPGGRRWASWNGASVTIHSADPAEAPSWRPSGASVFALHRAGGRLVARDAAGAVRCVSPSDGGATFAGSARALDRYADVLSDGSLLTVGDDAVHLSGGRSLAHGAEIVWRAKLSRDGSLLYLRGSRTGRASVHRVVALDGSLSVPLWIKRLLDFQWTSAREAETLRLRYEGRVPTLVRAPWRPGANGPDRDPGRVTVVPGALRAALAGEGAKRLGGTLLARGVLLTLGARWVALRDDGSVAWERPAGRLLDHTPARLLVREGPRVRLVDPEDGAVVGELSDETLDDEVLCGALREDGEGAWVGTLRGRVLAAELAGQRTVYEQPQVP